MHYASHRNVFKYSKIQTWITSSTVQTWFLSSHIQQTYVYLFESGWHYKGNSYFKLCDTFTPLLCGIWYSECFKTNAKNMIRNRSGKHTPTPTRNSSALFWTKQLFNKSQWSGEDTLKQSNVVDRTRAQRCHTHSRVLYHTLDTAGTHTHLYWQTHAARYCIYCKPVIPNQGNSAVVRGYVQRPCNSSTN